MNFNLLTWDESYKIGNNKVDSEHKKLFDIASKIYQNKINKEELMLIVKELVKYTKFHFANEENYMQSIDYEKVKEHKEIHKGIVNDLNKIIKELGTISLEEAIEKLSDFIYSGILQHILLVDKRVHFNMKSREELKSHFAWKNSYKINYESIDKEHEELFKLAIEALNYHDKDIKKHIRITIKKLYDYMQTHFKHEEEYMRNIAYLNLKEHMAQHEIIIKEMNNFIKSIPNLKIEEFERNLIEYIDIWLIGHIIYEDRKIVVKS